MREPRRSSVRACLPLLPPAPLGVLRCTAPRLAGRVRLVLCAREGGVVRLSGQLKPSWCLQLCRLSGFTCEALYSSSSR